MYQQFFGLRELPFELTPNPDYLFMTPGHREALSNLQYGLATYKTVTVLIGEAGTGKTTMLRTALQSEPCRHIQCAYVNNPALTRDEFVETLARAFGLSDLATRSKATMLAELEPMLRERRSSGGSLALVVDEAQRLSDELLEEIRLLANMETADEKLLPLVLTGQPELANRLSAVQLRQLRQRVSLRCEILPFELPETFAYIAHRSKVAGGHGASMFTREAVMEIHARSQGIPRTVNVLCDNALLGAFSRGVRRVNSEIVGEVCRDLGLGTPATKSTVAARPVAPPAPVSSVPPRSTPLEVAQPAVPAPQAQNGGASRELFEEVTRKRRFSLFG